MSETVPPLRTARLLRSRPLAEGTRHLEFAVEGEEGFDFLAGQYIALQAIDAAEPPSAFSIASPPSHDNRFALCLNRGEIGLLSHYLFRLAEGSMVHFHGPYGTFILRQPLRDSLFLATGTGIGPIRSMVHWVLSAPERVKGRQFFLLFGGRTPEELYYDEEFRQLGSEHPEFHYVPTLSRAGSEWTGLRGYVQEHVPALVGGRNEMDAYLCGRQEMVRDNRDLLVNALGWDRHSVRYERFE